MFVIDAKKGEIKKDENGDYQIDNVQYLLDPKHYR